MNRKPPTHIVVGANGDMLRGKLIELKNDQASFQTRESKFEIPRSRLSTIVWVKPNAEEKVTPIARQPGSSRLVFINGSAITLQNIEFHDRLIRGHSLAIGDCAFAIDLVEQIQRGSLIDEHTSHPYIKWTLREAPQPKFE